MHALDNREALLVKHGREWQLCAVFLFVPASRPRDPPAKVTPHQSALSGKRACDARHGRLRRRPQLRASLGRRARGDARSDRTRRSGVARRSAVVAGLRGSGAAGDSSRKRSAATTTSRPRRRASSNPASWSGWRARTSSRRCSTRARRRDDARSCSRASPNETFNAFLGDFNLAWEIDIWGRIRRATESARADYLGAEACRRGVLLTLVSDVAQAYFELLELDRELEIAQRTTKTFQDTLDLFTRRYRAASASLLEVSRGEAALAQARRDDPGRWSARSSPRRTSSRILLGRSPGRPARRGARRRRRCRRRCPPGCRRSSSSAAPTFCRPSRRSSRPTPTSASRSANFFPRLGLTSSLRRPELRDRERREERRERLGYRRLARRADLPGRAPARRATARPRRPGSRRCSSTQRRRSARSREVSNALVAHDKLKGVRAEQRADGEGAPAGGRPVARSATTRASRPTSRCWRRSSSSSPPSSISRGRRATS